MRIRLGFWCRCIAAAAVVLAVAATARADDYPSRYVTLIVPYAAGGPTDINARLLVPALSEALGQRVVVENRGGAGTTLGTGVVAHAAADGYTLLFADLGLAVSHNIVHANYNPDKDFVPVAFVSRSLLALVVHPKVPANSVKDLIALAKATGTQLTHVSYKGSGPAVGDVLGGQVPLMFLGPSASVSYVKSGQLKALAVTGKERSPALPDVPTFRELGIVLGGIDSGTWWGIVAPAGTPPEHRCQAQQGDQHGALRCGAQGEL